MIAYYLHYLLGFTLAFFANLRKKVPPSIFAMLFLILFLFAALRGRYVGRDYLIYADYFESLTSSRVDYFPSKVLYYEPSNYFIPFFVKALFGTRYLVEISIAFFALLGTLLKLGSFRISNSFFLSTILYLSNFYLLQEMTAIRAGVASGFFLLGIPYLYSGSRVRYCICVLLAMCFHYSSVIYFLPLLFSVNKLNSKMLLILLSVISFLSIIGLNIFDLRILSFIPKIDMYFHLLEQGKYDVINIWNNPGFLINLVMTFILTICANILRTTNKYFIIMLKIQICSVLVYMAGSQIPVFAVRMSQMLGIVSLCLYPTVIYCFKEKIIGYLIIILISLIYFYNHIIRLHLFSSYYTFLS